MVLHPIGLLPIHRCWRGRRCLGHPTRSAVGPAGPNKAQDGKECDDAEAFQGDPTGAVRPPPKHRGRESPGPPKGMRNSPLCKQGLVRSIRMHQWPAKKGRGWGGREPRRGGERRRRSSPWTKQDSSSPPRLADIVMTIHRSWVLNPLLSNILPSEGLRKITWWERTSLLNLIVHYCLSSGWCRVVTLLFGQHGSWQEESKERKCTAGREGPARTAKDGAGGG